MLKSQLEIQETSWKSGTLPRRAVANTEVCRSHIRELLTIRAAELYISSTTNTTNPLE